MVHSEIQKVHSMNRENLLKNVTNRKTMIALLWLTLTLNKVQQILKKAHRYLFSKDKCRITITPLRCISQSKNTERSFSKIKAKDA